VDVTDLPQEEKRRREEEEEEGTKKREEEGGRKGRGEEVRGGLAFHVRSDVGKTKRVVFIGRDEEDVKEWVIAVRDDKR